MEILGVLGSAHFVASKYGRAFFWQFWPRGRQPTSFGPRDTRGARSLGPPAASPPRWATCTSSRTPLEERRLLPSRLLLPTRDAVVSCAPARGLGWEISRLDQFHPVLPGLRRLGPNAQFIVWFSPGLVGTQVKPGMVWQKVKPV